MIFSICRFIERANTYLGLAAMWLVLAMVLVQFAIVVLRYVFGVGSLYMFESVIYMHGILFMAAAAYTLAVDKHVRVDIFYGEAPPRRKAAIDLFGALFLLLPTCALVWWLGFPYVARSWAVLEGSRETSGLPAIFLLKTFILVFAATLFAQGIVMAVRAAAHLTGRPMDDTYSAGG
ncbi:TRAP transporter small permease subunit [Fodinicurvata sp. EGI_FJ10296]|uniref:TRAP transporter small permease subunit n=1 Tax=Fodinicurvata sp. EGI_FJ10296 TaxID=3231908 RepID=UPI003454CF7D